MNTLFEWSIEDYEALAEVAERIFTDWRHPRHIELIRGYLKERGEPAKLSLAEYLKMVEEGIFSRRGKKRVELIRGEIREMSPIGDPHEEVLTYLTEWSVAKAAKVAKIRIQCSVRLPNVKSVPEPDVVWAVRRDYRQGKPGPKDILLLIEVSDSSLAYDTGEKAEIYAAAGVRDYWVVNIPQALVEVRRDPGPNGYESMTVYSGRKKIRPLAFPEKSLIPEKIWD